MDKCKIWYVSFQFYVRLHNNIQHSKWVTFCWNLSGSSCILQNGQTKIFTKYVQIYKYILQSQFYHHVERNFNREQQQKSGAKRRMKAVNIDKYSAKYCVLCSCSQEIVFYGYVTVLLCVSMCTIYTDLGRSKQSFFYASDSGFLTADAAAVAIFFILSVVVLR